MTRRAATEELICERCDEPTDELWCTHSKILCAECVHGCGDCQTEWAESRAYDDSRD